MKEKINVFDYAELIDKAIHPGVLLNTNGDKFNSMVIGWGHLGVIWGINTFVVYVRQSRYTKAQIDKTMEFTISVPMGETKYPKIFEVCGTMSGRDVNKLQFPNIAVIFLTFSVFHPDISGIFNNFEHEKNMPLKSLTLLIFHPAIFGNLIIEEQPQNKPLISLTLSVDHRSILGILSNELHPQKILFISVTLLVSH